MVCAQLWDIRNPSHSECDINAHQGLVLSVDWHLENQNLVASGSRDKKIKVSHVAKPFALDIVVAAELKETYTGLERRGTVGAACHYSDHRQCLPRLLETTIPHSHCKCRHALRPEHSRLVNFVYC